MWFTNMCSFRILDRGLGLVKVILPELAFISPSWIKGRIFVDLVILHLSWTYLRKNRTRCSQAWGAFEYTDAPAVQGQYKNNTCDVELCNCTIVKVQDTFFYIFWEHKCTSSIVQFSIRCLTYSWGHSLIEASIVQNTMFNVQLGTQSVKLQPFPPLGFSSIAAG